MQLCWFDDAQGGGAKYCAGLYQRRHSEVTLTKTAPLLYAGGAVFVFGVIGLAYCWLCELKV